MENPRFANRLFAVLTAVMLCLAMLFIVPVEVDTTANLQFQLMDTWVQGESEYFDNGAVVEDLGIKKYNDYLRELNKTSALPEVVIAVIDSGINMEFSKFQGRVKEDLAKNFNSTVGDADAWNFDLSGHGSHVSGIIVDSTLPNVKVLPLKIFEGKNENELVSSSLIDNSIEYIIKLKNENKANIVAVNMSLGTSASSTSANYYNDYVYYQKYINMLREAGILPIVAAGNDASSNPSLPAACSGTIAVSSYNYYDKMLSNFSNFGNHISLTAPGSLILSAGRTGNETARMSGTSMATPFVSACYAMLMSDISKTTATDLGITWSYTDKSKPYNYMNVQHKALLLAAVDVFSTGNDIYSGYGIVNVSSFAVAPDEVIFKPSKDPEELNYDITPEPEPEEFEGTALYIGGGIILIIIIIYAIRNRRGGGKDESTTSDI